MRFKHNPWVSLLAALVMTIIVLLYFTGCSSAAVQATTRFSCTPGGYVADSRLYVITDTETGEQYLLAPGSGLVKMED